MSQPLPAVLVAGATGGLGPAVVGALLAAGHPVTAVGRSVEGVSAEDGLTPVAADLLDAEAAAKAVDGVEGLGAVACLVGGYAGGARVHETAPADFERMLRLNLLPAFNLAHAAMPRLGARGGGAFVAVSARAAVRPFSGAAGYIAAKAGLLAFVQALDAEYGREGVRCNAILPSVIDTPGNRAGQPGADHARWVSPEHIANVVRFLVSEDSAPTSGAGVPVYGRA